MTDEEAGERRLLALHEVVWPTLRKTFKVFGGLAFIVLLLAWALLPVLLAAALRLHGLSVAVVSFCWAISWFVLALAFVDALDDRRYARKEAETKAELERWIKLWIKRMPPPRQP